MIETEISIAAKTAKGIFSNIQRAMELNPNDPFVLSMQGNVEFYSPFGSKKTALAYYQKADSLYGVAGAEYERWNRRAVQMTYIQCLHKLRREEEAKKLCEELLAAGFSMAGGNSKGIYAVVPFDWKANDVFDTPVRWHTGEPETDPWEWRMRVLEERDDIAYAKVFFQA